MFNLKRDLSVSGISSDPEPLPSPKKQKLPLESNPDSPPVCIVSKRPISTSLSLDSFVSNNFFVQSSTDNEPDILLSKSDYDTYISSKKLAISNVKRCINNLGFLSPFPPQKILSQIKNKNLLYKQAQADSQNSLITPPNIFLKNNAPLHWNLVLDSAKNKLKALLNERKLKRSNFSKIKKKINVNTHNQDDSYLYSSKSYIDSQKKLAKKISKLVLHKWNYVKSVLQSQKELSLAKQKAKESEKKLFNIIHQSTKALTSHTPPSLSSQYSSTSSSSPYASSSDTYQSNYEYSDSDFSDSQPSLKDIFPDLSYKSYPNQSTNTDPTLKINRNETNIPFQSEHKHLQINESNLNENEHRHLQINESNLNENKHSEYNQRESNDTITLPFINHPPTSPISQIDPTSINNIELHQNIPPTQTIPTQKPFTLLKFDLRSYQKEGVDWLLSQHNKGRNSILADEMGLGKTIQTISLLERLAITTGNWGPHLIIVPTSVLLNWEQEFKKWLPGFKILVIYGSAKQRRQKRAGWNSRNSFHICITTYQIVLQDIIAFKRKTWDYLVLDEAHNIKNFQSKRWQVLMQLKSNHRLLLTGTPLQNSLAELWSLLYFLLPQFDNDSNNNQDSSFADLSEFQNWFSKPLDSLIDSQNGLELSTNGTVNLPSFNTSSNKSNQLHTANSSLISSSSTHDLQTQYNYNDFHSADNIDASNESGDPKIIDAVSNLHTVLRPFILRRLKKDVEKQMPKKTEHLIYCTLSKRQKYLYDDFISRSKTIHTLKSGKYMDVMSCLMQLRKVCNHPDLFEPRQIQSPMKLQNVLNSNINLSRSYSYILKLLDNNYQHKNDSISENKTIFKTRQILDKNLIIGSSYNGYSLCQSVSTANLNASNHLLDRASQFYSLNCANTQATPIPKNQILQKESFDTIDNPILDINTNPKNDFNFSLNINSFCDNTSSNNQLNKFDKSCFDFSDYLKNLESKVNMKKYSRILNLAAINNSRIDTNKSTCCSAELLESVQIETKFHSYTSLSNNKKPKDDFGLLARITSNLVFDCNSLVEKHFDLIENYVFLVPKVTTFISPSISKFCENFIAITNNCISDNYRNTKFEHSDIYDNSIVYLNKSSTHIKNSANFTQIGMPSKSYHPLGYNTLLDSSIDLLEKSMLKYPTYLERIQKRLEIVFPDKFLIQYDSGKLQTLSILLNNLIKKNGDRVLIFSQMTVVLDVLEKFLSLHQYRYLRLDGNTKVENRLALTEQFNKNTKYEVFILSTRAGGVGINLTGANCVIFYDNDWNPSMDNQCMDRCHRIGQIKDVKVFRMICSGSVEESIWQKSLQKRMLDQVVIQDGNFSNNRGTSNLANGAAGYAGTEDTSNDKDESISGNKSSKKKRRKTGGVKGSNNGGIDWTDLATDVLDNLPKSAENFSYNQDSYKTIIQSNYNETSEVLQADLEDEIALRQAMKELETVDEADFQELANENENESKLIGKKGDESDSNSDVVDDALDLLPESNTSALGETLNKDNTHIQLNIEKEFNLKRESLHNTQNQLATEKKNAFDTEIIIDNDEEKIEGNADVSDINSKLDLIGPRNFNENIGDRIIEASKLDDEEESEEIGHIDDYIADYVSKYMM
ncbi:Helicase SWR1 [Smittium culicis]|uniref:Helicase SWR1 n=1 Tax=Smittium culicis TaxID=133412 RepID=A0A1R1Y1Z4_9FUNG|nr:Helicase SWR1 [Smittium culicis]